MTAVKIIQCQHSPRSASGTRPILCRSRPSLPQHKRSDGSEYDSVPPQATFSQRVPAFSLSHSLWHCPRGISYMPLALSTRRPRSASGTRPFCAAAVPTQPMLSQWDPAFLCRSRPFLPQHIDVKAVKPFRENTTPCDFFVGVPLALRQATKIEPHVQDLCVLSQEGANGNQLVARRGCPCQDCEAKPTCD